MVAWQEEQKKKKTGKVLPSGKYSSSKYPNLGSWVAAQKVKMRNPRAKNSLKADQIEVLLGLGTQPFSRKGGGYNKKNR